MNGRLRGTKYCCCLCDGQQITVRRIAWALEACNVPMSAEVADQISREAMAISGLALLTIENARDGCVGVMLGQTTNQCDCVLVGAHRCLPTRRVEGNLRESAATPTQCDLRAALMLVYCNDDFLKNGPQQLLLVSCQGGRSLPDFMQVGAQSE